VTVSCEFDNLQADMQDGTALRPIPSRPWRTIAQELSTEKNQKRIGELSGELLAALNEQVGHVNAPSPARPFPAHPANKPSHSG
jgi:hypothetical protein